MVLKKSIGTFVAEHVERDIVPLNRGDEGGREVNLLRKRRRHSLFRKPGCLRRGWHIRNLFRQSKLQPPGASRAPRLLCRSFPAVAFKIGTDVHSKGRTERESGLARKLAGCGVGQHAVTTRPAEFG